jgi:hypothetical protein
MALNAEHMPQNTSCKEVRWSGACFTDASAERANTSERSGHRVGGPRSTL